MALTTVPEVLKALEATAESRAYLAEKAATLENSVTEAENKLYDVRVEARKLDVRIQVLVDDLVRLKIEQS